jgi:hypothetical protein
MDKFYLVKTLEFTDSIETTLTEYDNGVNINIAYHEAMSEAIGADNLKAVRVSILTANHAMIAHDEWSADTDYSGMAAMPAMSY